MTLFLALLLLGPVLCRAAENHPLRTTPLIRGTLWWVVHENYGQWSRAQFEQAIDAQRAAGFDLLWLLNTPDLFRRATADAAAPTDDVLATLFDLADAKNMQVIVDLPLGGWYGKTSAEDMTAEIVAYAQAFHQRYGKRRSFYGWYLNHEINPIAPDDADQSVYWRHVWRDVTAVCRRIAPKSVVTISPFFLLDETRRRGFVYLTPAQYGAWWEQTLTETHIDIVMLQDSGEHLSFFTLDQRAPFFEAMRDACKAAGARFWLNVESGEANVANWDEYLALEQKHEVPWRVTPIDWLERKLRFGAQYADAIVNWGYFPYMDPLPPPGKVNTGSEEAYNAYQAYSQRIRTSLESAATPRAHRKLPRSHQGERDLIRGPSLISRTHRSEGFHRYATSKLTGHTIGFPHYLRFERMRRPGSS
jgi:hypothetical protein